jgi:Tetracyclin repressor-like, C-terminal domain
MKSIIRPRAAAGDAQPGAGRAERLWAIGLAYRDWALAHPQDYLLIFGTPIPGYHAPAEITGPAAKRSFDVLAAALLPARGGQRPRLRRAYQRAPGRLQGQVEAWRTRFGYELGGEALLFALETWTRIHGLVSLELVGQIEPFFGDAGELYRLEIRKLIEEAGLRPEAAERARGNQK